MLNVRIADRVVEHVDCGEAPLGLDHETVVLRGGHGGDGVDLACPHRDVGLHCGVVGPVRDPEGLFQQRCAMLG